MTIAKKIQGKAEKSEGVHLDGDDMVDGLPETDELLAKQMPEEAVAYNLLDSLPPHQVQHVHPVQHMEDLSVQHTGVPQVMAHAQMQAMQQLQPTPEMVLTFSAKADPDKKVRTNTRITPEQDQLILEG